MVAFNKTEACWTPKRLHGRLSTTYSTAQQQIQHPARHLCGLPRWDVVPACACPVRVCEPCRWQAIYLKTGAPRARPPEKRTCKPHCVHNTVRHCIRREHAASCLNSWQRCCDGRTRTSFVSAQGGPLLTFSASVAVTSSVHTDNAQLHTGTTHSSRTVKLASWQVCHLFPPLFALRAAVDALSVHSARRSRRPVSSIACPTMHRTPY
jgi:hypothetical protein